MNAARFKLKIQNSKFKIASFLSIYAFCFLTFALRANAQTIVYPGNVSTTVNASVGGVYLSISGYTSPYASIVMTSNGQFIRSVVADALGNFFISQILVRENFSNFCLSVTDFKRLGEAEACLDINPVTTDTTIDNIFLPPTVGLLKKEISAGDQAVIYGYSRPNSTVIIKSKDGNAYTAQTDSTGYYSITIKNVQAGTYSFLAYGKLDNKESLPPKKGIDLTVLSLPQQVGKKIEKITTSGTALLTSTIIGFLILLLLLIIIIIIIIILILRPKLFRSIFDKLHRQKGLHHDWLLKLVDTDKKNVTKK